ncbi:MAG: hypothetical protein M1457_12755 [bacterium]|nr:hypothetical protein [bacterium]
MSVSPAQRLGFYGPPVFVLILFYGIIAVVLAAGLRMCDAHFVYRLDDAYIHMAVAKNLVRHGVWGVTPQAFTSSTSSLVWPGLLAITYAVTGVNSYAPLVLNLVAAGLLIVWLHGRLRRMNPHPGYLALAVAAIVFVASAPALVFSGLEHVGHILIMLVLLQLGVEALADANPPRDGGDCQLERLGPGRAPALLALAALAPAVRYESLFLVGVLGGLFYLRGRRGFAVAFVAAACLPIGLYGLYSRAHGWFFLPNSVVLKGQRPDFYTAGGVLDFAGAALGRLGANPAMLLLLTLAAFTTAVRFWKVRRLWDETAVLNLAVAAAMLPHLLFIELKFSRYDAYLAAMVLYGSAVAWHRQLAFAASAHLRTMPIHRFTAVAVLIVAAAWIWWPRTVGLLWSTPAAMQNIYRQQYQMADFLRRYHDRDGVAVNDIGLVSFATDARILDVWGLANMAIARNRPWKVTWQQVDRLAREGGVRLAMVYDSWFLHYGGVPPPWIKVGTWTVPELRVLGDTSVSIYAVDPAIRGPLVRELREFARRLPPEVMQAGPYTVSQAAGEAGS